MPPNETLFLESTTRIQKDSIHSFMDFQVWDFPGQLEYFESAFDLEDIFGSLGALVWVIDAQDDYLDSVARLNRTILTVQQFYPGINIEVFIHKVDGLSDEYRTDTFQDIVQRISDELSDAGYENAPVHYYLTSIYDYSVFEAFSKVIQKLIPNLSTLENLINTLANNCGFEKTYLFDVLSKIYIASDTRPVDMACYEMCSDYIDVIVDISELYSWDHPVRKRLGDQIQEAESHVVLHDQTMIHLMEMNKYLCLVSVIRNPEAKEKRGLIDMNCRTFQDALNEVFSRSWEEGEMSELRQRSTATSKSSNGPDKEPNSREHPSNDETDQDHGISLLDIIRVVVTLLIACGGLSYYMTSSESVLWGYRPWYTRWPVVKQWVQGPVTLTPSQLSLYNGTDTNLPIYVAVNGSIFDVSENRMIYGPGGSYNFFAGRDATRAFVTGCFKEDLTNDMRGVEIMFLPVEDIEEDAVTPAQKKVRREKELRAAKARVEAIVKRWTEFFANHAKYFKAGWVVVDGGVDGEPWPLCESAQKQRPKRSAMAEKEKS
ncbi:Gtr1/RagA G protein [Penicillium italicum]|uniref:Gtr1/RagA G protein n=1 Tax=Penicillium italicum TaxID=40296 RepID=A0A0A2L723_PENIT|nr:Gtr1/RagA G protein [Penicillium italicum]